MATNLQIYRSRVGDKILAVHAQDTRDYSAIYIVDKHGRVEVASDLQDINGDLQDAETWAETFAELLAMDNDFVSRHQVDELPQDVMDKFNYWLKQART